MTISEKQEKSKKSHFFGLRKIISRKTRFFLIKPVKDMKFLVRTKKFRLDMTISKKQEKSKKSHFFGLQKIISQKTRFFLNPNR